MNQVIHTPDPSFVVLLRHLHRGGRFGFWSYESEEKRENGRPQERCSVWWSTDSVQDLPPLQGRHGLRHFFYGVHPCSKIPTSNRRGEPRDPEWVRSQVEYICAINCVYAEFDAKDFGGKDSIRNHFESLRLRPSAVVDSGGGFHCYWLLQDTWILSTDEERSKAKTLQHAWVATVGGDKGAKNLNRVLRIPNTYNVKKAYGPDYPMVHVVDCDFDRMYSLEQIRSVVPQEALNQVRRYEERRSGTIDELSEAAQLLQMLNSSRCDNYDDWLKVGMALSTLGSAGFGLWDSWSRNSSKYERQRCENKWQTFRGAGSGIVTLSTLAGMAKEDSPAAFAELNNVDEHHAKGTGMLAPSEVSVAIPSGREGWQTDLIKMGADDEGNAKAVHLLYGDVFCYTDAYGWMHFCGSHWDYKGAEAKLERAIVASLKKRRNAAVERSEESIVKAAKPTATNVRSAKFLFRSMVTRQVEDFDRDPDLLNVANGAIHLPTGELRDHAPEQLLTYCVNINYDPEADPDVWVTFLEGVVESPEVVPYLQQCVGYSLTGHTSEEVLWYIYGPSRSGKGTFTETVLSLLGIPLCTEVDFATFTRDRDNDASNFDLAPLKPARLIFASESSRHQRLNTAKIKALTGGNSINCCFKHKDHFSYRPQYKIWLTSNHPVNADVDDDAVWGRLRVLQFPNSRLGQEDKGLKSRMRDPAVLQGVLAWAVKGAAQWFRNRDNGLSTPDIVTELTAQVRAEQDTVAQWMEECVKQSESQEVYVVNSELYSSYQEWCQENGVTPKKQKGLTQALMAKGIPSPRQKKILNKNKRVWFGLSVQS